jgi:Ribonuclease G/E
MIVLHKCPVCDGTGKVSRPPWIAGDVEHWSTSSSEMYECKACNGECIIVIDEPGVRNEKSEKYAIDFIPSA